MGRLFQCDWCGAAYDTRDAVALVDIEFGGGIDRKVFGCPDHLPPGQFPAADGEPLPDSDPVITPEEAQTLGIHSGDQ
jgi:hypothetical protein